MKASRLVVLPLVALGVTGCLATKGDMRLLQTELASARAQAARADSAQRRKSDSLATALATLASMQASGDQSLSQSQQRFERIVTDELKSINTRLGNVDITTKERLKSLEDELERVKEMERQNVKGAAAARAADEQRRAAAAAAAATTVDTSGATAPVGASAAPGPATLLVNGITSINGGSCSIARRGFQEVVTLYPQSIEAPQAQYLVAETYVACGSVDPVKADSVYRVVTEKYPTSDYAAISLYKRAELNRNAGRADAARPLYLRVVCEYKNSTVFAQAKDKLGSAAPVCRPGAGAGLR